MPSSIPAPLLATRVSSSRSRETPALDRIAFLARRHGAPPLGTLYGHAADVTLARVEAACAQDRLWRYGAKVRAIVAAKRAPARAIDLFHAYVAAFGNDFDMARTVLSLAPENVKRDVARMLGREASYLPHEPAPWKLLGLLFDVGKQVADEIDARLHSQS